MPRSPQGRRIARDLDKELAAAAQSSGKPLEWTAAERAVIGLITAQIDRIADLTVDYDAAVDSPKIRVKLSSEMRLLEASVARLLKQVRTDIPAAESLTTIKARRAAHARWRTDAAN